MSMLVSRLKGAFVPSARSIFQISNRGFATEQQIKRRLKTVGNIKKITKAMKMVAAAKLRSVQNQLEIVRKFQKGPTDVWPDPKLKDPSIVQKNLLIVITSDRGLCGSVNSQCSRQARRYIDELLQAKKPIQAVMFGDKGKAAMERIFAKTFAVSVSEGYKSKVMSFKQAAMLANIINTMEFDKAEVIFNKFKNLLSFETTRDKFLSWGIAGPLISDAFSSYVIEDAGYTEVMRDLHEFRTAVRLFHCFQENATSEQSSRMNAMGNSAKNAGEMQDALRLLYNRTRQAKITTELIEIISGASSAEAANKEK
jgi:F-type H+-transporting ATPase subunit gamma